MDRMRSAEAGFFTNPLQGARVIFMQTRIGKTKDPEKTAARATACPVQAPAQ